MLVWKWLGLLSCLWVTPVIGAEESATLKKLRDTGTISIGYRDSAIPFSYLDDRQRPIGLTMDLCGKVVDSLRSTIGRPDLRIELVPVTSATRIPLVANGTVDLECGSTTNNVERQSQVGFSLTFYIAATRFVSKRAAGYKTIEDLRGKSVASTAGTTPLAILSALNRDLGLGITILPAKDHAEAFLLLDTNRAQAFFMDDITLGGLAASSKTPDAYQLSERAFSVEPYGLMVRKGDDGFRNAVDAALKRVYQSGDYEILYRRWFLEPIPPRNINLKAEMSPELRRTIENPTDSGDAAAYR